MRKRHTYRHSVHVYTYIHICTCVYSIYKCTKCTKCTEGPRDVHIYDRYVPKTRMSFFIYSLLVHTIYTYVKKSWRPEESGEVEKWKKNEERRRGKSFHVRERKEGREGGRGLVFPNALRGNCLLLRLVGPGTWSRPFAQRIAQIHRGSDRYPDDDDGNT